MARCEGNAPIVERQVKPGLLGEERAGDRAHTLQIPKVGMNKYERWLCPEIGGRVKLLRS